MIKKLCSYPGCHKVVEAGVKYCDKHRETDRKKYREYKQRRMRDEQEARRQQFYNSKAWEQFRAAQAAAQLGIDIYEYYTTGRIIDAENYHHIQEITEAWARRLDAANVIGLSEANHRRIHKEYDRSYKANDTIGIANQVKEEATAAAAASQEAVKVATAAAEQAQNYKGLIEDIYNNIDKLNDFAEEAWLDKSYLGSGYLSETTE